MEAGGWGKVENYARRAQWVQVIGAVFLAIIMAGLFLAHRAGYVVTREDMVEALNHQPSPAATTGKLDDHETRIRSLEMELRYMGRTLEQIDKRLEKVADKLGVH